ncbi:type II secretion system protein GspK [Brevundimonas aurantiaca]|jgi:hypothetical protein|uniref:type II secretion system protein GspK n=1 Tax=Brevundimonas aurantiaca TaxID=74316 RepID=UPI00174A5838|nr:type II secretion system protein GspK [Brevundimonas aurantiaca]
MVTLIFLVAMTALTSLTDEARAAQSRVRFLERALTAEARFGFTASTEPFAPEGINVGGPRLFEDDIYNPGGAGHLLYLDGRAYDADGSTLLSARDQAGMINLAQLRGDSYLRLARVIGLGEVQAGSLADIYGDYVDQDNLKRSNGAEAADYRGAGPPNRVMRTRDEWLSLLNVRSSVRASAWREIRADLAMDPWSSAENVNTASPLTMQVLYGATADGARNAVRQRQTGPFLSFADFAAAAGAGGMSDDVIQTYPSGIVVLTLRDSQSGWIYQSRLTLSPAGSERPFWIDQVELYEAPRRAKAEISNALRLPYASR